MPWPAIASAVLIGLAWLSALAIGWARLQRDIAHLRHAHAERLAEAAVRAREEEARRSERPR